MSQLKALAGQTAIYGLSSILGRVINYLLVGLHTSVFLLSDMGTVSELYGSIALILIVITFGMETTFFRFSSKQISGNAYGVTSTVVLLVSSLIALLIYYNAGLFGLFIVGPSFSNDQIIIIQLMAGIIMIDGIMAIPFAKLRIENKPMRFVLAKLVGIIANIILQVLFLIIFPAIYNGDYLLSLQPLINNIYNPNYGIEYIFIANLLGNLVVLPFLGREFLQLRLGLSWPTLRPMLVYALPLVATGLAGWIVSDFDKLAVAKWAADGLNNQGIYTQTFKLGALMLLAIQAFRYAAEPFFFAQSTDKNAPELLAKTFHYFVIFALLLLLVISVNIEWIAHILLRKPEFRTALYLVPIIMFGKLLFGVYINISIWYKLKDKTIYGLLFTLIGATVAITVNYLLLPVIGMLGSAIAIVLSYLAMSISCYFLGRKYMPVPYNFTPLLGYSIVILALVISSFFIQFSNNAVDIAFNITAPLVIFVIIYKLEKRKILAKIEN